MNAEVWIRSNFHTSHKSLHRCVFQPFSHITTVLSSWALWNHVVDMFGLRPLPYGGIKHTILWEFRSTSFNITRCITWESFSGWYSLISIRAENRCFSWVKAGGWGPTALFLWVIWGLWPTPKAANHFSSISELPWWGNQVCTAFHNFPH